VHLSFDAVTQSEVLPADDSAGLYCRCIVFYLSCKGLIAYVKRISRAFLISNFYLFRLLVLRTLK